MKSVGELLTESRRRRGWSLEQVSGKTKIQKRYLKAIEGSRFDRLPTGAAVKGFIRNYALAVGTDVDTVMAMFRRDFVEDDKGRIIPRGLTKPIDSSFAFTPRTALMAAMAVLIVVILGFFGRQIYIFYSGPRLEVAVPSEGDRVTSPVRIEGKVTTDAVLKVNSKDVPLDSEGRFETEIQLTTGEHTIVVTAEDRKERQRSVQRFVVVE